MVKAAVLVAPRTIEIRDFPEPEPDDYSIVARPDVCGICGTDLHLFEGHMNIPYPLIMGHEFTATVEKIGAKAKGLEATGRELHAGDLVAVVGIGGLGHLAVQFAAKMGCKTVAIARGRDEEPLARQLGAHYYIDNKTQDPAAELLKLGGAKVILATVTSADAMKAVLGGLSVGGTLMIIGAVPSFEINSLQMLLQNQSVTGWYSGTSIDSQDTLNFSVLSGVHSMNEVFPFDRVTEAYEHMLSGKARFRVVLNIGT